MIKESARINQVKEYYFSKKLQEVRALGTLEKPMINLGIGSPDLPPPSEVIETLSDYAKMPNTHAYQPYKGIAEFRKSIANYYKKYFEVELNFEEEILPMMGSKEAIMHIMMAFVDEGDAILLPDPGYPTYTAVAEIVRARPIYYDLKAENDWQISIEALEQVDLSKIKLLMINTPHMPTGSKQSRETLKKLIELARKHDFLIVNDNPYSMILNTTYASILSLEGAKQVAVELNSLSKSHNMAGWRVGWCMGRKEHVDAILKVKSNMDSGMFLPIQMAAVSALKQEKEWFKGLNSIYQERKQKAEQLLSLLSCAVTAQQTGMFLWSKVSDEVDSVEHLVDEVLHACHVFICPGFIFGKNGDRYLRISLCCTAEDFQIAIDRITSWKQSH